MKLYSLLSNDRHLVEHDKEGESINATVWLVLQETEKRLRQYNATAASTHTVNAQSDLKTCCWRKLFFNLSVCGVLILLAFNKYLK